MKKIVIGASLVLATLSGWAANSPLFTSQSFLQPGVSIRVTNATAAPFGGFTNVNSWTYGGILGTTNTYPFSYTNGQGTWVVTTNTATFANAISGINFVNGDYYNPAKDVMNWTLATGSGPWTTLSNIVSLSGTIDPIMFLNHAVASVTMIGDASHTGANVNLIFVGVPDGTNEPNGSVNFPIFQWGVAAGAGTTVITTNFPMWRFAGCKSIRLRSASTAVAAAAAAGCTIKNLTLNGFVP